MYNPASIVDLRQNISFNQPKRASGLQRSGLVISNNENGPFQSIEAAKLQGNYFEGLPQPMSSITMNKSINPLMYHASTHNLSDSSHQSCDNCSNLEQKVFDLEERLRRTDLRVSKFEREVLDALREVSRVQSGIVSSQATYPPGVGGIPGPRRSPSLSNLRSVRPSRSDSTEATREAIANACLALEGLIATATASR